MVNNVIGVVNYVIAARPSLLNFMIADTRRDCVHGGRTEGDSRGLGGHRRLPEDRP
jgi:hypothetical protein